MLITDLNCENLGLRRLCLMESAGKSLSDEIAKIATYSFSKPVKIAIFTGSGGNAGDGFVAARYLLNRGFEIEVYMLSNKIKSENAKINLEILNNLKPTLSRLKITFLEDLEVFKTNDFSDYIIIDAILGTGINGKLKTKVRDVIKEINNSNGFPISVDLPSGMDPLTGEIADIAIKPKYTVTFHKVKTGIKEAGEELVGGIVISDIGIPLEAEFFTGSGDLIKVPSRDSSTHKGNNGKILIIGGNKDYSGAPILSALSAFSTGVDLVYILAPDVAATAIKSNSPDSIVHSLKGDYLNLNHLEDILNYSSKVDAVLIGPGAGLNEETGKLFNILVSKIKKPIVLDADALKLVNLSLVANNENIVLTPHLSEFKEFFSISKDLKFSIDSYDFVDVNENISQFQKIIKKIKGTVLLKGQYDLILRGNNFKINKTGNPGMTVGGTGDVLAGLTVSLLSKNLDSFDSAVIASYLNGKAGDLAYADKGYGFKASDIPKYIGILMEK